MDQNAPGFLIESLEPFQLSFPILHVRSPSGLSAARNVGLDHAIGQIIAFPDDDCWYASDVLETVANLLMLHSDWAGLTGRLVDPTETKGYPWYDSASGRIKLSNVWHRSSSVTIFLRRTATQMNGYFDTNLGRGSATGMLGAEDSEYLIRIMKLDLILYYCAEICIFHEALPNHDEKRIAVVFGEGRSFGYVLRKYNYPLPYALQTWIRALGGTAQSLLFGNTLQMRFYWNSFKGRIRGWFEYPPHGVNAGKKMESGRAFRQTDGARPKQASISEDLRGRSDTHSKRQ